MAIEITAILLSLGSLLIAGGALAVAFKAERRASEAEIKRAAERRSDLFARQIEILERLFRTTFNDERNDDYMQQLRARSMEVIDEHPEWPKFAVWVNNELLLCEAFGASISQAQRKHDRERFTREMVLANEWVAHFVRTLRLVRRDGEMEDVLAERAATALAQAHEIYASHGWPTQRLERPSWDVGGE